MLLQPAVASRKTNKNRAPGSCLNVLRSLIFKQFTSQFVSRRLLLPGGFLFDSYLYGNDISFPGAFRQEDLGYMKDPVVHFNQRVFAFKAINGKHCFNLLGDSGMGMGMDANSYEFFISRVPFALLFNSPSCFISLQGMFTYIRLL
jgi:hypothetical protein